MQSCLCLLALFVACVFAEPLLYGIDIVHTPFGLRHKDCVMEVPSGTHIEAVQIDGEDHVHLTHPDGTKILHKRCAHELPQAKGGDTPIWNGYAEHWWFGTDYAEFTKTPNKDPVTTFTATWTIPPAPTNLRPNTASPWPNEPTLSFWTGLQPSGFADVLQPVLEFNGLISKNYDLSSWNCCPANYVFHSTPIGNIKAGDVAYGNMELVNPSDPYTYKIVSMLNNGANTTLTANMTASKPRYTWSEVKSEGYFVTSCDQLPGKPFNFVISKFVTSAGNVNVKTIPWQLGFYECANAQCPAPLCHATSSANADTVTIAFQN